MMRKRANDGSSMASKTGYSPPSMSTWRTGSPAGADESTQFAKEMVLPGVVSFASHKG